MHQVAGFVTGKVICAGTLFHYPHCIALRIGLPKALSAIKLKCFWAVPPISRLEEPEIFEMNSFDLLHRTDISPW
jgi:hypothetical protein